jgi:hypothetical protein
MKVDKNKFDELLNRLLKQKPEKTQAIKGTPGNLKPIVPAKKG